MDFCAGRAFPRHVFSRLEVEVCEGSVVGLRDLSDAQTVRGGAENLYWSGEALASEDERLAVLAHRNVIIEPVGYDLLYRPAAYRHLVDRLATALAHGQINLLAVGREG